MVLRRRPLLRAAAVGTAAGATAGFVARKTSGASQAPPQQAPAPAAAAPSPAAPAPMSQADRVKALTELKGLLDSGAVSQQEFDQMKKGLLEGAG